MLESGILIDERYRLDALIGEGAMGQVWRAADIQLENESVAIKFLTAQIAEDEVWRREFHREMQTLVKLGGHAYLVQVSAYGLTEGIGPYMVMEYLSRGSLKTRLSEVQSNPTLLRQILSELCDALDYLHQDCSIVHLDLKPSNILFDAGNHIRLADFGIARALDNVFGEVMPLGTPGYRAPEQEQGCAVVDHRADLYALGMVARELLEQSFTPQIEKLLDKATAPDPAARYTTANELWRALQPLLPRHYAGGYLLPEQKYDFLVKQLPYSLQERVSRALNDYTRVFGGRQAEMEALDQWLDEADKPFGIVQAPTGRGKTALLIQWALNVQGNGWHVIFFPISQRYETADQGVVVRSLTYALATLFQVDAPGLNTAPDWLLAQVADWLRRGLPENKRLLVVVDGLDEAIGDYVGALFPNQVAPDVKILVAARTLANEGIGAWAARLKWTLADTHLFDVGMLARRDLRDIVNRYADDKLQALAADDSFIAELWRISEGDPLTVRMLMDDLAAGHLVPQDLSRRPVGLQAYLQAWLEGLEQQVESEAAWQLLGLCATAYGPLTTDDLVALDPVTFNVARHVRQAVRPVARVLLGDGEEEHGYVFNHPRLREFFYERLSEREHTAYQKAFVDYGQRCYVQLPQKPCPPYVRRFWTTHLAKVGEWDLLHQVIATGEEQQVWAEMRYATEGGYTHYLRDLEVAWIYVQSLSPSAISLARQIRYALIRGSILEVMTNLPAPLVVAEVRHGLLDPVIALREVKQVSDPVQMQMIIDGICGFLEEQPHRLRKTLMSILQASDSVALHNIMLGISFPHLIELKRELQKMKSNLVQPALELIDKRLDSLQSDKKHPKRKSRHPHTTELPENFGLATIKKLPTSKLRTEALVKLAPTLSESQLGKALKLLKHLDGRSEDGEWFAAIALRGLASYLSPDLVKEALNHILQMPCSIGIAALSSIASRLSPQLVDRALAMATKKWGNNYYLYYVGALASQMSTPQLKSVLDSLWEVDRFKLLEGFRIIAPCLKSEILLDEVVNRAFDLSAYLGMAIIQTLAPNFSTPQIEYLLTEVPIRWGQTVSSKIWAIFAPYLPEHLLMDALVVAETADADVGYDGRYRSDVLIALAPRLSPELLPRVIEIARSFEFTADIASDPPITKTSALVGIMPALPTTQRLQMLPEVLHGIEEILESQNHIFLALIPNLPGGLLPYMMLWAYGLIDTQAIELLVTRHHELSPREEDETSYNSGLIINEANGNHRGLPFLMDQSILDFTIGVLPSLMRCDMPDKFYKKLLSGIFFKDEVMLEALGFLRGIERRQWQIGALRKALPFFPESVMEYALTIVLKIERRQGQTELLAELIPFLPYPLLRKALDSTLDRKGIEGAWYYEPGDVSGAVTQDDDGIGSWHQHESWSPHEREERLWKELYTCLNDELLEKIREVMSEIQDEDLRNYVLQMLSQKTVEGTASQVEANETMIGTEALKAIDACIKGLPPNASFLQTWNLLKPILSIQSYQYEPDLLVYLTSRLPASYHHGLYEQVFKLRFKVDQVYALSKMVPYLTNELRLTTLHKAVEMIFFEEDFFEEEDMMIRRRYFFTQDEGHTVSRQAWSFLIPAFRATEPAVLYPIWHKLLRHLSAQGRKNLLICMELLYEGAVTMNAKLIVPDISTAIQDVGRWWQ